MKKYKKHLKLAFAMLGVGLISIVTTLLALNLLIGNKKIDRPLTSISSVGSPSFERTMSQVLEPAILEGNSVKALVNGDQIFPAMLSAIQAAQKTITLETYIYWSGDIGQQFAQALEERARQGVKINILIDWYGSEINEGFLEKFAMAGFRFTGTTRLPGLRWTKSTIARIGAC